MLGFKVGEQLEYELKFSDPIITLWENGRWCIMVKNRQEVKEDQLTPRPLPVITARGGVKTYANIDGAFKEIRKHRCVRPVVITEAQL